MRRRLSRYFVISVLLGIASLWLWGERGRLLLPSSKESIKANNWRNFINFNAIHSYIYGRWTRQYMALLRRYLVPRMWPGAKRRLADGYHSKVLTPELARAIVILDKDIPLRDLEQIVPFPQARELILNASPELAVYDCACRLSSADPCQPTQVCLIVGQPFVGFVLDHHPGGSRRLSQEEALALLQAEHERGHVHTAWFKDASMGRFYAICNCCSCCCAGIETMTKHGIPLMASSGYVAEVQGEKCIGCGKCATACPFAAISVVDGKAVLNWDACLGCGVCTGRCPTGAISLARDERKGIPLDVRLLAEESATAGEGIV